MKQVIVMRNDLGMRKGKMIAQGAHASMGAILPYLGVGLKPGGGVALGTGLINEWLAGSFKKICVRVDSENELLQVYEQATKEAGLITCLITDSGLTEFHGVPTVTCCAIGPDTDENLDPITGELKLL